MSGRLLTSAAAAVIAEFLLLPGAAAGQAQTTTSTAASKATTKNWTPPKTSWGHPDLQGIYTNSTIVPLERPANFADKPVLTDAEVAERFKQYRDNLFAKRQGDTGFYNEFWWEWGKDGNRTSLIIDPPDGKLPATAQTLERAKERLRRFSRPASYDDFNAFDRCITRSLPGAMMPGFYNHYYQILQTPQYVALVSEMIHDVRIIPLDDRPHVSTNIRQWLGDSRGRWDGTTLVVETTNLNDKVTDRGATYFGVGPELRLIERFTRVDADRIDYRFTVEAPSAFTRPWTAAIPMWKSDQKIFEYACHEGNYAMPHSLSGARAEEARAAAGKQP